MNINVKVATQGPLFTRAAADKMVKAVNSATRELVQKGEQRLAEQLRPRPAGVYLSVEQAGPGKASTGNYRRNISTEFKNMSAMIHDGNVVYGPWLEGISSRNNSSRFKGYGVYRQTGSYLQKISRGIYDAHARHWAKKMKI